MKKFNFTFLALLCFFYLLGCASTSSLQNAPLHAGKSRTFEASFTLTLKAAQEAIVAAGLQVESTNQIDDSTWMLMAKKPTSAWSWGELVRLLVVKKTATSTEVRVYTKKKVSINVAAKGDYSESIFASIELKLQTS